ncbi:MAG: flagellar M-ring protein FliF [Desulfobacteraceae bacterium]|nr:MAG: flagellar M-ring protein FliF [Desulfobacteraceae bacterium]
MAETGNQLSAAKSPENPVVNQIVRIYKDMPLSRKVVMGIVIFMVILGFAGMFFWANKIDYQTLYTGLSADDASAIVEKLKELGIKYELAGDGNIVRVPAEKLYDARLSLAAVGLPKGGNVGYELFDETDFGTTEFVQQLNYKRALQGELSRTIKEFREVEDARVMIVTPKESVFVEESKPPSASVLLKLKSDLSPEKISAVVHLVASSLEGMTPELVTVVDTKGRVLSHKTSDDEKLGDAATTQFKYKNALELNLAKRIQTMLEQIVGTGKAIVRVTADLDFSQVDMNEELYDPDIRVIRSRQNLVETFNRTGGPGEISSVNPIVPPGGEPANTESSERSEKQDETINYELNRTLRRTVKPVGTLRRLSVATVLDGTYIMETGEAGQSVRKYIARTDEELSQFRKIVQNAMGYSEDREDQITVESFPFAHVDDFSQEEFDWKIFMRQYGRSFTNIFLIFLLFIFVVLPLLKTMKEIKVKVVEALPSPDERRALLGKDDGTGALTDPSQMSPKEKSAYLAKENMGKAVNIFRGWLSEAK